MGIAFFFLGVSLSHAQEVAEAARQDQAQKAAAEHPPRHVYTDEDLKKDKILTPDDQAKVAARKRQEEQVQPAQTAEQKQQPAEQESQTESLGEIARRYRRESAERQAEEATKKNYTPFQYELAHPMTAVPKAEVVPVPMIRSNPPSINLLTVVPAPAEPRALPKLSARGKGRISPFQPRPPLAVLPELHVDRATTPPIIAPVPGRPVPVVPHAVVGTTTPQFRSIQVQAGDSWWKLATRYLGSGGRWTELRELNPQAGDSAELLRAGTTVQVPERMRRRSDTSPTSGSNLIRVKAGDTLWSLAHKHLGRGSAWTALACLNPGIQNYQHMAVGTLLQLNDQSESGVCAHAAQGLKN